MAYKLISAACLFLSAASFATAGAIFESGTLGTVGHPQGAGTPPLSVYGLSFPTGAGATAELYHFDESGIVEDSWGPS